MFSGRRHFVLRSWPVVLAFWIALAAAGHGIHKGWINRFLPIVIRPWTEVLTEGEFAFLPPNAPSQQAERLFREAFPNDLLASSIVVVVRRESRALNEADQKYISTVLVPQLAELKERSEERAARDPRSPVISRIRDYTDKRIGNLLVSRDGMASLVIIDVSTEFLDDHNRTLIGEIEEIIHPAAAARRSEIPAGLNLALSGSATVGRDMNQAVADSARNTERWTIGLVFLLLLGIYRAPLLAVIPLLSVFVAVEVSLGLIIVLAQIPGTGIEPFHGLRTYITVVTYGAGVDYCLFLIARYKEELDRRNSCEEALAETLRRVGAAIVASAATVACGIFMMYFAQFGKFQQAGLGIAMSLAIMLVVGLTFTPAVLLLVGTHAFWPRARSDRLDRYAGWISGASPWSRVFARFNGHMLWQRLASVVIHRPLAVWGLSVLCMLPFAVWGAFHVGHLSYGLLSELPANTQSVIGAKAVQDHFPAGETGPVTILLQNPQFEFHSADGVEAIRELTEALGKERDELRLADIRSVSHPMGFRFPQEEPSTGPSALLRRGVELKYYISQSFDRTVTRLDMVFVDDPFSRDSVKQLERLTRRVRELLPAALKPNTTLHMVGTTAGIRDLKAVTNRDQVTVDALVLMVVFVILVILLRRIALSAYLVISVFFSYFVALGVTHLAFQLLDPGGFAGLDWKVPMFLFTILIAVGEDYNIFLMTRIDEEQKRHGPVEGLRIALTQTGSIISSCGIIMAGTFFSLVLAGRLVGMQQLGFALTFGVLLDTFVVRPILVPAWLMMLHQGHLGEAGRYLGAPARPSASAPPAAPQAVTLPK